MSKRAMMGMYMILLLFILGMAAAFIYMNNNKKDTAAVSPLTTPEPSPALPTLLDYWSKQVEVSEQAGQYEVASNYRTRISTYTTSTSSNPIRPEPTTALPKVPYELYLRSDQMNLPANSELAKHEPASGTYLGMFGADRRVGYDVNKIESVYGRKHAIYLSYVGWRKIQTDTNTYFPQRTADRVKALDGALQIGWEPRYGLDDVKDDEYVRRFAREAKASGIPIFLRYASEMNGAWVPWYDTPEKSIEKFRLIHDIMEEEAPNVAMVWSPNFSPVDTIDSYYPGDEYVDWVGFSLYSTPESNGKEELTRNVIDHFTPLYDTYKHKPIMISEGAIAHTLLKTEQSYWAWAEGQLGYMYGFLPRMFPQIKAMTYFNFSRAQAIRTNSNYVFDLGENPYTDMLYKKLITTNQFLSKVEQGANPASHQYQPINGKTVPAGKHTVMVYTQLKDGSWPFAVALFQGNNYLGMSYEMPWEIELQVSSAQSELPLQLVAYNQNMEPIAVGDLQQ
jgi:hypothetical protein